MAQFSPEWWLSLKQNIGSSRPDRRLNRVRITQFDIGQYFSFKLQYFQDNLYMILFMGAIFGVMRIIGAIGLLKNRMWGLALSVINCVVTMILMMFMLPFGIQDGLLACIALVLILTQYFGNRKIIE